MAFDTHGANGEPWTGFDLDGTLAVYDKWRGVANIGKPVKPMCDLIRKMHDEGKSVKILTARVAPREDGSHHLARVFIARWCRDNLGFVPPITHEKDALMETLYDDRVKAVEQNTGKVLNMARFKVGDKVRRGGQIGVVRDIEKEPYIEVKFTNEPVTLFVHEKELVANAAHNAKFKVGDKVRLAAGGVQRAKVMREVAPMHGEARYHIKWEDGDEDTFLESELVAANSSSRNDIPGRYKPGARVAVELRTRPIVGKVMQYGGRPEVEYSPTTRTRFTGTLIKQNGDKWDIKSDSGEIYKDVKEADFGLIYNSRSHNAVVQKALNATARNVRTIPVDAKGKGIIECCKIRTADGEVGEVAHIDEDGFVYFKSKDGRVRGVSADTVIRLNADTSVLRETAVNGAGYVDASAVTIRPGDAVVFKAGYRLHSDDDEWLDRNGDTVREVRGQEVKLGPSANDWAKKSELMVWHNAARSCNAVVQKALNAARTRNAVGRDKQDEASVETWTSLFENNFLKFQLPKATDKERARKTGEKLIKYVEDALGSEGGRAQLKKMGWTIQKMRDALEKGLAAKNAVRNADKMHDIDAHGKKLVKGDWVRFLMDLPDVKKGECAQVAYALPGGLIFKTLAGAREISWDASVVEKMPPIPSSLSQIEAWKNGPRA